jgi:hypothetical protein
MASHLKKKTFLSGKKPRTCISGVSGTKMAPFLNVIPGGRFHEQDLPPKYGGIY